MDLHDEAVERILAARGVAFIVGGLDSGKTTLALRLAGAAAEAGLTGAIVDADLGQSTVGPPGSVGLKLVRGPDDLARTAEPDALAFVGSITPQGHMLPLVTGAFGMLQRARSEGADVVAIDTTGAVSGVFGQLLKFYKLNLTRPDFVVGLSRGEELEPVLGIARRFFPAEVYSLPVDPSVVPTSVDQRASNREAGMRAYFSRPLQRWRVKPTVFMPALPALFDLRHLDRLLVGLRDGRGEDSGVGYLEHAPDEGVLRLISPVAEAPKALRLGSVRLDEAFQARRVDLHHLFGTD